MQKEYLLSLREQEVVHDVDWLYTKQRIIDKVYQLFGALSEAYAGSIKPGFDEEIIAISPKIYRGENYQLLPYVMLDFPRFFRGGEAFSIRSLFWWGKEFSIHLVLGDKYKIRYQSQIMERIAAGRLNEWYISVTDNPWQHHFGPDNYQLIGSLNDKAPEALLIPGNYLKLARRHSLENWDRADVFFINAFSEMMGIL